MSDSDLISDFYAFILQNRMIVSMRVLALFEYATTIDEEISSIWKRKPSCASLLLFVVRYTMLIQAIVDLSALGPTISTVCTKGFFIFEDILLLLGLAAAAAFSALRVYALCGRNVILSSMVFLLQLSPLAVDLYDETQVTMTFDPLFGCRGTVGYGRKTLEALALASRIPLIAGDALVIIITWAKSFRRLQAQHILGASSSLSTVLFRDGAVYFLILLIMSVLQICPLTSSQAGTIIGSLNGLLPLVLINRFMLNLYKLSDSEARLTGRVCPLSTQILNVDVDATGYLSEPPEHGWEPMEEGILGNEGDLCGTGERRLP